MRFATLENAEPEEQENTTWRENFYECMVATPRSAKTVDAKSLLAWFLRILFLPLLLRPCCGSRF